MERFGFCLQRFIWSVFGVSCLPAVPAVLVLVDEPTFTVLVPSEAVVVVVVVVVVDPSELVCTVCCVVVVDPSELLTVTGGFVVTGGGVCGFCGSDPVPMQIGIPDESKPPCTVPLGHGDDLPPDDVGGMVEGVDEPAGFEPAAAPQFVPLLLSLAGSHVLPFNFTSIAHQRTPVEPSVMHV